MVNWQTSLLAIGLFNDDIRDIVGRKTTDIWLLLFYIIIIIIIIIQIISVLPLLFNVHSWNFPLYETLFSSFRIVDNQVCSYFIHWFHIFTIYPRSPRHSVPGAFSPGKSGSNVLLTTQLQLVPKSRKAELYLHSHICLHGIPLK
jgi:hypothetical protein